MERTAGPQNKICTIAYHREDQRTTKQDLHLNILYLQMEKTAEQQKLFALKPIISPNEEDRRTPNKICN
jgi:hypothetical protein